MDSALQLFANAGDGVFAVDQEQRILYWNSLATETLGYAVQETLGQYCWQLLDGKTVSGAQICSQNCPIIQKIREKKPVEPFNIVFKDHSGKRIILNISSIGLPKNGGDIVGLVHIQRDV